MVFATVPRPPGRADVDLRPRCGVEPGHLVRLRAQQSGVGQRRHHQAGCWCWSGLALRPNPVPEEAVVAGRGFGRPREAFIEAYPWNIRGNLIPPTAPFGGLVKSKY